MTTRQAFGFGLALGLTLALGFVLGSMFTPHATAQTAAPSPQRWEYMVVNHGFDHGQWANEQGAQGWRFVAYDLRQDHEMIFERPLR